MVLIMWVQNRPSLKSRPSLQGSLPLTLTPNWPPLLKNQTPGYKTFNSEMLVMTPHVPSRQDTNLHILTGFEIKLQRASNDP